MDDYLVEVQLLAFLAQAGGEARATEVAAHMAGQGVGVRQWTRVAGRLWRDRRIEIHAPTAGRTWFTLSS